MAPKPQWLANVDESRPDPDSKDNVKMIFQSDVDGLKTGPGHKSNPKTISENDVEEAEPAPPPYTASSSAAPAEGQQEELKYLGLFDTVLVVDDSGSMSRDGKWSQACDALKILATQAAKYDKDGIDIYFINDLKVTNGVKTARKVDEAFAGVYPGGMTPLGKRLKDILDNYFLYYEAYRAWERDHTRELMTAGPLQKVALAMKTNPKKPKPLNLLVITDGRPTDQPREIIKEAVREMDRLQMTHNQIGIQLIQIGKDKEATRFLKQLDDELANDGLRDIVDTTPYDSALGTSSEALLKMLLGGIQRRFDHIENDLLPLTAPKRRLFDFHKS